jgi:hypothetical protein
MRKHSNGYTNGYTSLLGRKDTKIMQFKHVFHRRPINVGVIAGDLWQAHSR